MNTIEEVLAYYKAHEGELYDCLLHDGQGWYGAMNYENLKKELPRVEQVCFRFPGRIPEGNVKMQIRPLSPDWDRPID